MAELVGADPQDGVLDRRDLGQAAVEQRRDGGVERLGLLDAAMQQRVVVRTVGLVKTGQVAREGIDRGGVVSGNH